MLYIYEYEYVPLYETYDFVVYERVCDVSLNKGALAADKQAQAHNTRLLHDLGNITCNVTPLLETTATLIIFNRYTFVCLFFNYKQRALHFSPLY